MHDDDGDDDDDDVFVVGTFRRSDWTEKDATHGTMLVRMSHITTVGFSDIVFLFCNVCMDY